MFRILGKSVGAAAAVALLIGAGFAFAEPPRAPVREGRAAVRDTRIERRAYRNPGDLGLRLGAIADRGLAIANLATNGAFYVAGLRPSDYIVSVNGHRIVVAGDFDRYLYAGPPDQPVPIVIWRSGSEYTVTVQPSVLYLPETYETDLVYFGVEFDPQYTDQLVVVRVIPDSLAFRAGLRAGDVITGWNGRRFHSPKEFAKAIHDEKPGRVGFDFTRGSKAMRASVMIERRGERGPGDRTAQRPSPPAGREPNPTLTPPTNPREPIPTVRPPANPREPTPKVTPPTNPREPIPTVRPPAERPAPATPPAGREPPRANPPPAKPPVEAPRPGEPGSAPREK